MSETTSIEWCDSTFNPWIGCQEISPGCSHCYAAALAKRTGRDFATRTRTSAANWKQPLRWNSKRFMTCSACGWRGECAAELIGCGSCGSIDHLVDTRRRVFCASMADVFDNQVDPQWRVDLFELIAKTPNLDWLLLTKRIGNARAMLNEVIDQMSHGLNTWDERPWPGVWLGATVVNQQEADRDIPKLLGTPARVRFLSMEPLVGAIHLRSCPMTREQAAAMGFHPNAGDHFDPLHQGLPRGRLDWVIAGGESGPQARPMSPDWARSVRDQCASARVPFLFKQWGEWIPMQGQAEGIAVRAEKATTRDGWVMGWAGKKAAGRLLDGLEHNGFPEVRR